MRGDLAAGGETSLRDAFIEWALLLLDVIDSPSRFSLNNPGVLGMMRTEGLMVMPPAGK